MATATVDVTKAPAKILSVTELKNGNVYVVTEGKVYQLSDGKLRPIVFADVEHDAVVAGSTATPVGAVPAAPPPVVPPKPATPASAAPVTPTSPAPA